MSSADLPPVKEANHERIDYARDSAKATSDRSLLECMEDRFFEGELFNARQCICDLLIENQQLRMKLWALTQAPVDDAYAPQKTTHPLPWPIAVLRDSAGIATRLAFNEAPLG